jgi:hypothetical protein
MGKARKLPCAVTFRAVRRRVHRTERSYERRSHPFSLLGYLPVGMVSETALKDHTPPESLALARRLA